MESSLHLDLPPSLPTPAARTPVLPELQWIEVQASDDTAPTDADIDAFIALLDGILRRVLMEALVAGSEQSHREVRN